MYLYYVVSKSCVGGNVCGREANGSVVLLENDRPRVLTGSYPIGWSTPVSTPKPIRITVTHALRYPCKVRHNAKVGAEIAVHLASWSRPPPKPPVQSGSLASVAIEAPHSNVPLESSSAASVPGSRHHPTAPTPPLRVAVFGGAVADIISKPLAGTLLTPGTSTPGETRQSFGGVGRNVAEGIARVLLARQRSSARALSEATPSSSTNMGDGEDCSDRADVTLVSAVGADSAGKALVNGCHEAGVNAESTVEVGYPSDKDGNSDSSGRDQAGTASYVAMLGCDGDLVAAVADMRVLERMTPVRSLTKIVTLCSWRAVGS